MSASPKQLSSPALEQLLYCCGRLRLFKGMILFATDQSRENFLTGLKTVLPIPGLLTIFDSPYYIMIFECGSSIRLLTVDEYDHLARYHHILYEAPPKIPEDMAYNLGHLVVPYFGDGKCVDMPSWHNINPREAATPEDNATGSDILDEYLNSYKIIPSFPC